jgi:hypothetical protein
LWVGTGAFPRVEYFEFVITHLGLLRPPPYVMIVSNLANTSIGLLSHVTKKITLQVCKLLQNFSGPSQNNYHKKFASSFANTYLGLLRPSN